MGFIVKVIGYVLVLLGVLCPLAAGYVYYSREPQVRAYFATREDFAALDKNERAVMADVLISHQNVVDALRLAALKERR